MKNDSTCGFHDCVFLNCERQALSFGAPDPAADPAVYGVNGRPLVDNAAFSQVAGDTESQPRDPPDDTVPEESFQDVLEPVGMTQVLSQQHEDWVEVLAFRGVALSN